MTVEKLFIAIAIVSAFIVGFRLFKQKANGIFLTFVQTFLGLLFIFSGIVKAIDPLGTAYKLHDYFGSFAQDGMADFWYKMEEFDVIFSVSMIVFEIALGIAILIGWRAILSTFGMLAINIFFLFLTGYSYLSGHCITKMGILVPLFLFILILISSLLNNDTKRRQALSLSLFLCLGFLGYCKMSGSCLACEFTVTKMKVTDCGCFGDFMKLKPWVTFYKDILLTILSLFLVWYKNDIKPVFNSKIQDSITGAGTGLALIFCLYNFVWTLPIVDFRPYAIGNNIKDKMIDEKPAIIENILIYKNTQTGEKKEFGINELPTDTIWQYADRLDKVIDEGILAPIKNLRLTNDQDADITQDLLNETQVTYWIVCSKLAKTNREALKEKIAPFAKKMKAKGIKTYILLPMQDETLKKEMGSDFIYLSADETALKTMIRSNPGIMKIENGTVINMWHWRQFNGEE
jgi:hypothetical protein